jgi:RNA polymerase sigma-70 factor (ECF subfamily)
MNPQADEAVMLEVRDGQISRLSLLFERHHRQLYNFFYRLSGSAAVSEDLVQEVFLRLLKYRHTYNPKTSFAAWMYQVARNAHIDTLRGAKPEAQWSDELPEPASSDARQDERVRLQQEQVLLRRALAALPPDKRELLILSRYQNLPYEQIGQILGCDTGAVKTRVFRAVRALGQVFAQLAAAPRVDTPGEGAL